MEKFKSTMLFDLSCGDRFHFATDKKMKVYEVTATPSRSMCIKADADLRAKESKKNSKVVFLRNINDKIEKEKG